MAVKAKKNDTEEFTTAPNSESIQERAVEIIDKINSSVDLETRVAHTAPGDKKNTIEIPLEEEIACKSVVFGGLTWISPKTNAVYRFEDIGSIEYIPFAELITLNNTKKEFLSKPYFVVQDPRVVKYFRLLNIYEQVAQIHNLEEVFRKPLSEISKAIDSAIRVNMRDVMISKAREMRRNGTLTNIDIIQLLEKKLCFAMEENDILESKSN